MLVEVDRMMFLHLPGLLYLYSTFLSSFLEYIELLLDLVDGVIGHGISGVHSKLMKIKFMSCILINCNKNSPLLIAGQDAFLS